MRLPCERYIKPARDVRVDRFQDALTYDNNLQVATGSRDRTVKVWDVHDGACLWTAVGHEAPVSALVFKPSNGGLLASVGADRTIRVWDIDAQVST